jgi:hypothetical protein
MEQTILNLQKLFTTLRFPLEDEKELQKEIAANLNWFGFDFTREQRLDDESIIDFLVEPGIGVEVKIGNKSKMNIYKQVERYCSIDAIHSVILLTNKSMSLPETVNNKPTYIINLSQSWL